MKLAREAAQFMISLPAALCWPDGFHRHFEMLHSVDFTRCEVWPALYLLVLQWTIYYDKQSQQAWWSEILYWFKDLACLWLFWHLAHLTLIFPLTYLLQPPDSHRNTLLDFVTLISGHTRQSHLASIPLIMTLFSDVFWSLISFMMPAVLFQRKLGVCVECCFPSQLQWVSSFTEATIIATASWTRPTACDSFCITSE